MEKEFGIVCDIDGVVFKSKELIEGSKEALHMVKENGIPLMFITNGGGMEESKKASLLSKLLEMEIHPNDVILSHTPFRDLGRPYFKKRVIVIGVHRDESLKVMDSYGFENVEFYDDYLDKRPYLLNYYSSAKNMNFDQNRKIIPKELLIKEESISAIFVLHEPVDWFSGIQLSVDILSSNGQVGKKIDYESFRDYNVPIFISNPDLEYSAKFYTPRLTAGAFCACIETIFERKTGGVKLSDKNLVVLCGKPFKYPYEYVENLLVSQKRFYMIGDNPKSDIQGANKRENWYSILVRTGCHQLPGNDRTYPADQVCMNLLESIKFILKKEKTFNN